MFYVVYLMLWEILLFLKWCCSLKGVASRKRKRNDKSSGVANNSNDACSTDGYGILENKKFSPIRSDSKKKKHCGNLNATRKPLKSGYDVCATFVSSYYNSSN